MENNHTETTCDNEQSRLYAEALTKELLQPLLALMLSDMEQLGITAFNTYLNYRVLQYYMRLQMEEKTAVSNPMNSSRLEA